MHVSAWQSMREGDAPLKRSSSRQRSARTSVATAYSATATAIRPGSRGDRGAGCPSAHTTTAASAASEISQPSARRRGGASAAARPSLIGEVALPGDEVQRARLDLVVDAPDVL